MSKGQYSEAARVFDELGSYEDSTKLTMYCKAADAGEKGVYNAAFSTFSLLGEYKDCKLWNGKGKQYHDNELIFEGEYKDGKRQNGKGKEYCYMYPLDFEEGKKNNDNRQLIFEGKYKNGKRIESKNKK